MHFHLLQLILNNSDSKVRIYRLSSGIRKQNMELRWQLSKRAVAKGMQQQVQQLKQPIWRWELVVGEGNWRVRKGEGK